jgi:hypothetical protein
MLGPKYSLFLQNTDCNVFTSQIILNSMNGKSNKIISLRKLDPPGEGDEKRRVSQGTAELPMGSIGKLGFKEVIVCWVWV